MSLKKQWQLYAIAASANARRRQSLLGILPVLLHPLMCAVKCYDEGWQLCKALKFVAAVCNAEPLNATPDTNSSTADVCKGIGVRTWGGLHPQVCLLIKRCNLLRNIWCRHPA